MRVAILSRNPALYSTRRLVEAAETRGHETIVLDTLRCTGHLTATGPEVHYEGTRIEPPDVLIPRIGSSITSYGLSIVRQFEAMGVWSLAQSIGVTRSRDKLRAHQFLARKGIALPRTAFAHQADAADDLVRSVGGPPVVVKLLEGTQGVGVVLCETRKAAESVIQAFRGLKAHLIVQEFVREAGGADLRLLVVGDRVVAGMRRQAAEGEFRSNLHRGGTAAAVRISPVERRTAVMACKALGLRVAGVDLLPSDRGPLVLEVNSSPGLEGIERATGVDVADRIVAYAEKNARVGAAQRAASAREVEAATAQSVSDAGPDAGA
ncbi:MAG TPA: 30S ribosomal protein S6--L-glutamate ligase [Rubricoccaceae bacterium]|jgi:ribosomal protein S6--L-glutamate ligase